MNERLAALPITHVLRIGSTIWPQSKQSGHEYIFPMGVLRTDELQVARVPNELALYHQRGQALFYFAGEEAIEFFETYFQRYDATHKYYAPWILFGFLHPENKLTESISQYNHPKKRYKQDSLL